VSSTRVFTYDVTAPGGFLAPGQSYEFWWGPWDFQDEAVVVTAHPVQYGRYQDAMFEVSNVRSKVEYESDNRFILATVTNVFGSRADIQFILALSSP
jgi:hypothetical protein